MWFFWIIAFSEGWNVPNSYFQSPKNCKNGIFWSFAILQNWFHVKSQWQENAEFSTLCNSHLIDLTKFFKYEKKLPQIVDLPYFCELRTAEKAIFDNSISYEFWNGDFILVNFSCDESHKITSIIFTFHDSPKSCNSKISGT